MRIALVSPYDLSLPGGVQSHVLDLAAALGAGGDEVEVIAPGEGGHTGVGASRGIPFNGSVAPIAVGPAAARRTAAAVRASRADVVHVHEPMVPVVGPAAVRAAGSAPVVATFHAASASHRLMRAARPLGRRLLRRIDDLVAVSPAAARTHAAALGIAAERFRVIGNGVDYRRFAQATPLAGLAGADGPVLLFVGRLEPRKGLDVLLRAYARLVVRRPEVGLVIVGEGPELARCHQLLPRPHAATVRFLGRVEPDELPRVFAACDVFVSPARGGESFGIVLIEAMAAGCVVVASDIEGYRDIVTDGVDGRQVPVGDPESLADALEALLDDPVQAAALVAGGRRRAEGFDWSHVAGAIRQRYLEALVG